MAAAAESRWCRAQHWSFGCAFNRRAGALLLGLRRLERRRAAPAMDPAVLEETLEAAGLEPIVMGFVSTVGTWSNLKSNNACKQFAIVADATCYERSGTVFVGFCNTHGEVLNMWKLSLTSGTRRHLLFSYFAYGHAGTSAGACAGASAEAAIDDAVVSAGLEHVFDVYNAADAGVFAFVDTVMPVELVRLYEIM